MPFDPMFANPSRPAVAAVLSVGLVLAPVAQAAAADSPQAALEVEVKLGEGDDEILAKRVDAEARKTLGAKQVDVVEAAEAAKIMVAVSWNENDDHAIAIKVATDGTEASPEGSPYVCEACNENQLIAKVAEAVEAAVPLLPEPADDGTGTPAGTGDPTGDGTGDHGGTTNGGPKRGLGTLGKVGIPVMVLGVGGMVAGGVLLGLGESDELDAGDPEGGETVDYRPPGIAALAGGGALLIAGAALLVADRLKARRGKSSHTTWQPFATPRTAGLSLTTRF